MDKTSDKLVQVSDLNQQQPQILQVPITELAEKAGGRITANTVAAGASLSVLGAPFEIFHEVLSEHFSSKKEEVAKQNISAAKLGYEAVKNSSFQWGFQWKKEASKGAFIDGSRAIALGALAADCRFAAFYPMSPATGIMTHLSSYSDDFPLVVEQVEDEIAAVNMIIGASFAGVRAMTSTSGGGFCLMTEGLGLAAITETPVVIVNAQRPGPATGLPTRTAQGDLQFVIWASQDEFPRFVFAPGTPSEAFETTIRAFHLAEKYQVPVIILSDQYLNDSIFTADRPLTAPERIERFITNDGGEGYKRYAITPDGVSPRVLPCSCKSLVIACGNEHREDGHTSEDSSDRINMVNKRNAKIPNMLKEMNPPKSFYGESETLIVGWGSSHGAIQEGVELLRAEGMNVGCLIFTDIYPFRSEEAVRELSKAERFFVAEANSTAQFAKLIRQETGLNPSGTILKYDGRPFFPVDIVKGLEKSKP